METLSWPGERFDLAVSSMALHYVADYAGLVRRIASWLSPGGVFVFSTEHPVYLSRATDEGWVRSESGEPLYWALSRYGEEGLRRERWFVDGVEKHHRMVSTLLNGLADAGFVVERVLEPLPDAEMLERHPEWVSEGHRPFCLLVRARKPAPPPAR